MKNISEIIDSQVNEIARTKAATEQTAHDTGDFIHGMFKALKLSFPAWRQNFKTEKEYK